MVSFGNLTSTGMNKSGLDNEMHILLSTSSSISLAQENLQKSGDTTT